MEPASSIIGKAKEENAFSTPELHGKELKTVGEYMKAAKEAADHLKKVFGTESADVALILGSGHKGFAESNLPGA